MESSKVAGEASRWDLGVKTEWMTTEALTACERTADTWLILCECRLEIITVRTCTV